ncbi:hypothetical protein EC988_006588, partial [Linderina pennispora]
MHFSTTRLVLARILAEELSRYASSPLAASTITAWAQNYIAAGRNPSKYHFSIALRRILQTTQALRSVDGAQLSQRLASHGEIGSAVFLQHSSTISVHLSRPFLLAQAVSASQAVELGQAVGGLAGQAVRIVKWIDDFVDVSRYRSALSGDTMARVSVEVAKLSGAVQENYEVMRGHPEVPGIAKETRRLGNRISQQRFASKHMPRLLTALRERGHLLHDARPNVPALTVCLNGRMLGISDEAGELSSLAMDACVLYMLVRERPGSETWLHYVPDSRRSLHWQNVVAVAGLAGAQNITHRLCSVGPVEVSASVAAETPTGRLLGRLGVAGWQGSIDGVDEEVQRAAVHCAMAGAASAKPFTLECLEGPSAGAFLQYNHARLCRILAPFPCPPEQWLPIDSARVNAPEADLLALL